jgi:hypothetical protein
MKLLGFNFDSDTKSSIPVCYATLPYVLQIAIKVVENDDIFTKYSNESYDTFSCVLCYNYLKILLDAFYINSRNS